jgi:hypothetical protein
VKSLPGGTFKPNNLSGLKPSCPSCLCGEILCFFDRLFSHAFDPRPRIAYVITYFEDQNKFYRVFCWSTESKAAAVKSDFEKIAKSFQEKTAKQDKTAKDANHI